MSLGKSRNGYNRRILMTKLEELKAAYEAADAAWDAAAAAIEAAYRAAADAAWDAYYAELKKTRKEKTND
tara:strand:- start:26 stop:235 length:210 start_codon:yes stop_codon:yes gene_type:complete